MMESGESYWILSVTTVLTIILLGTQIQTTGTWGSMCLGKSLSLLKLKYAAPTQTKKTLLVCCRLDFFAYENGQRSGVTMGEWYRIEQNLFTFHVSFLLKGCRTSYSMNIRQYNTMPYETHCLYSCKYIMQYNTDQNTARYFLC